MIDFKTSIPESYPGSYKSLTIALSILEDYMRDTGITNDEFIVCPLHLVAIKNYYDFMDSLKKYLVDMDSEQKLYYFKAFKILVDIGLNKMESDIRTVQ